jgi:hypothetical protein
MLPRLRAAWLRHGGTVSPIVILSLMVFWGERAAPPASVLLYPSQAACLKDEHALHLSAGQHVVCLERSVEINALIAMEHGDQPGITWERDSNNPTAPPYMVYKKGKQP